MNSAEQFLKAKKKEAMSSLGLSTQPQFNQWLKNASEEDVASLATNLGFVASSTSEEVIESAPALSLEGMDTETFTAKDGTAIAIARLPITRTAAVTSGPSKGQILVVCELAGIGEVIVRNSGHIVALVREGIDMVGYKLPIALSGATPLTRRKADFNGVAQFDGRVVESADENLIGFANAQREEARSFALLTPEAQKLQIAQKTEKSVAEHQKKTATLMGNALAAFKK
jgi:hypothetical protein